MKPRLLQRNATLDKEAASNALKRDILQRYGKLPEMQRFKEDEAAFKEFLDRVEGCVHPKAGTKHNTYTMWLVAQYAKEHMWIPDEDADNIRSIMFDYHEFAEASADRRKFAKPADDLLLKRYKATPEELNLAKEVNDDDYLEWVLKSLKKNLIRLPEDKDKLQIQLETFTKLKRTPDFKKEHSPDINSYTPAELHVVTETSEDGDTQKVFAIRRIIAKGEPGAALIAREGNLKCFYMTDAEKLSILATDTAWCVREVDTAESYLNDGPAFMFYKGDKPYALMHPQSAQFMDTHDKEIWKPLDYDDYSNTSHNVFLASNNTYFPCIEMIRDTQEYEEIFDSGEFPEILTEYTEDFNVENLFERGYIVVLLKYFLQREKSGTPIENKNVNNIIDAIENEPDSINELFSAVCGDSDYFDTEAEDLNKLAVRVFDAMSIGTLAKVMQKADNFSIYDMLKASEALSWDAETYTLVGNAVAKYLDLKEAFKAAGEVFRIGGLVYETEDQWWYFMAGLFQVEPTEVASEIIRCHPKMTRDIWDRWLSSGKNWISGDTFDEEMEKLLDGPFASFVKRGSRLLRHRLALRPHMTDIEVNGGFPCPPKRSRSKP